MGSAAIRLKFSSLVKNKSKCCLEIVPEIASIQNMDKIKWTQDADSIEYVIPITYKIKLKKLNILKENHNLLRNYYSCVDLVHSSSFSYLDKASGDVLRSILSDHPIQIPPHFDGIDTHINISRPIPIRGDQIDKILRNTKAEQSIEIQEFPNKTFNLIQATQNRSTCVDEHHFLNENNTTQYNNDSDLCEIDNSIPNLPCLGNPANEIKNLSVAPICKITTNGELIHAPFPKPSIDINSTITSYKANRKNNERMNGFDKNRVNFNPLKWNFAFGPHFAKLSDSSYHKPFNIYQTSIRCNPKVRVAHFKSAMEREILPLKIILQDLLTKCAALGFLNNKPFIDSLTSPSNKCKYSNDTFKQNEKRCNRVVYSIVFDE